MQRISEIEIQSKANTLCALSHKWHIYVEEKHKARDTVQNHMIKQYHHFINDFQQSLLANKFLLCVTNSNNIISKLKISKYHIVTFS